jgi:putative ABC transport system ATP-binding protein
MLTINNITKTFNRSTPDEMKALNDFSLSVKPGEFVTLIGANGAGKSTLFNAICGNFITDSGSIILDGHDITVMPQ